MIQDLPGIYSLSPYSAEEGVTRDFIIDNDPDVILDIVDATNIECNLLQLLETQKPVIITLNMTDLLVKQGRKIDLNKLSYLLEVPVVSISALKRTGFERLIMLLKRDLIRSIMWLLVMISAFKQH